MARWEWMKVKKLNFSGSSAYANFFRRSDSVGSGSFSCLICRIEKWVEVEPLELLIWSLAGWLRMSEWLAHCNTNAPPRRAAHCTRGHLAQTIFNPLTRWERILYFSLMPNGAKSFLFADYTFLLHEKTPTRKFLSAFQTEAFQKKRSQNLGSSAFA